MGFLDMIDWFDIIGGFDVVIIDFFFRLFSVCSCSWWSAYVCNIESKQCGVLGIQRIWSAGKWKYKLQTHPKCC